MLSKPIIMIPFDRSFLLILFMIFPLLLAASDPPTPQVLIDAQIAETSQEFTSEIGVDFGTGLTISHLTKVSGDGSAVGLTVFAGVDAWIQKIVGVYGHVRVSQFGDKTKNDNSSYSYKINNIGVDAGIKLHLIPHIRSKWDPFISVGLDVAVNTIGSQRTKFNGDKMRDFFSLNENDNRLFAGIRGGVGVTLRTDVIDISGGFVVVGGLTQLQKDQEERSVPLLFEIPVIARLFFSREKQKNREELLILIKPEIVEDQE